MGIDHVRLMFRDKFFTWKTGEDVSLCAHARKYANIRCFTLPIRRMDKRTWGFSSDYRHISKSGDTTLYTAGLLPARSSLMKSLWDRGDRRMWSVQHFGPRSQTSVFLFANAIRELEMLACIVNNSVATHQKQQQQQDNQQAIPLVVEHTYMAISGRGNRKIKFSALSPCARGAEVMLNFEIGRDFPRNERSTDVIADMLFHFNAALEATLPTMVIVEGTNGDVATLGAALATNLGKHCLVNLFNEDKAKTKLSEKENQVARTIRDLADVTVFYDDYELQHSNDEGALLPQKLFRAIQMCAR